MGMHIQLETPNEKLGALGVKSQRLGFDMVFVDGVPDNCHINSSLVPTKQSLWLSEFTTEFTRSGSGYTNPQWGKTIS